MHWRIVVPPPAKTVMLGERSFTIGGPSLWNQLSDTVKATEMLSRSKKAKDTYLGYRSTYRFRPDFYQMHLTLVTTMRTAL